METKPTPVLITFNLDEGYVDLGMRLRRVNCTLRTYLTLIGMVIKLCDDGCYIAAPSLPLAALYTQVGYKSSSL